LFELHGLVGFSIGKQLEIPILRTSV
jgi:hypothetical protein